MLDKVKTQPMKTALLTEIIARIMKCDIHQQFREKMQEYKIPCEEPYKESAVKYLNVVISRDTDQGNIKNPFWGSSLTQKISQKFAVVYGNLNINGEEPRPEEIFGKGTIFIFLFIFVSYFSFPFSFFFVDAQNKVDLWHLVKRFLILTGISLTMSAKTDLKAHKNTFFLHQDDIEVFL